MLKDVELDRERPPGVHVFGILAAPAEGGAALDHLEAGKIDALRPEELDISRLEIIPHNPDHPHLREEAGGERKVNGRPAERVLHLSVRSADRITGHGTDDKQRHGEISLVKRRYHNAPGDG